MIFRDEYETPCPVCGQLTFWYDHERGYRICLNDECGYKETDIKKDNLSCYIIRWFNKLLQPR